MKIGEVARRLGVPVHVLRHWDEVGAVIPDRSPSGRREYDEEHIQRLRILRACQEVGMSLGDIRLVLHRREPGRADVIERHLRRVLEQRARLDNAERFLVHVLDCRHDLLTRCEECTEYASSTPPHEHRPAQRTPVELDASEAGDNRSLSPAVRALTDP